MQRDSENGMNDNRQIHLELSRQTVRKGGADLNQVRERRIS